MLLPFCFDGLTPTTPSASCLQMVRPDGINNKVDTYLHVDAIKVG